MYIKKILLKNIRGFRELEFDLERGSGEFAGWTVFTGDNGSGKSTVLKAIGLALLGKESSYAMQPSFNGWIRDGAGDEKSSIKLDVVRVPDDDAVIENGTEPKTRLLPSMVYFTKAGNETVLRQPLYINARKRPMIAPNTIWSIDVPGWFSCGYGPFRRVFGASPEVMRQMTAPTTERFITMFQEAASLMAADQWIRDLNYKALEGRESEKEQLALLLEILRDDLLPNEMTVDRVDSDGLWLKDRNGVHLAWRDMSDGYRSALALLADILRHLINRYGLGGLTARGADGEIYVKRSGVVLIDEIDAHLHPEWQRVIGFWLKCHFPYIQFLVTTHSPIICQAADENGLFVLPEPGSEEKPRALTDEEYHKVIASRPDTILLTSAFGLQNTRSPIAVESRAELAKLRAKIRAGAKLTHEEAAREKELSAFVAYEEEL